MISLKLQAFIVLLGIIFYFNLNLDKSYVIISTKFGQIKGIVSNSRDGNEFISFFGIPYALPPIGKLRFQPPIPSLKWEGVRNAIEIPPVCPQFDPLFQRLEGNEDCLFLNVYAPENIIESAKSKSLPVIVFIHGGHFMYGGSNIYGPEYFMDEDVILVTIQYRLGALGFLNMGPEARGNMGLKDQVLALKWIRSAIRDFGGNPDSVTLMGESAGAASVNYHMISPRSDGLFHRAISHSGNALCPWAFVDPSIAKEQGRKLGIKLGCPTEEAGLIKCLKEIDAIKILETQVELKNIFRETYTIYGPTIEFDDGQNDNDIFLFENPYDSAADGQFSRIPWILGIVRDEGALSASQIIYGSNSSSYLKRLNQEWNVVAPNVFLYKKDDEVSNKIRNFYFGSKKTITIQDYETISKMCADRWNFQCNHNAAIFHAKDSSTYLYDMDYKSNYSIAQAAVAAPHSLPAELGILLDYLKNQFYRKLNWEVPDFGISHADDLQYFFSMNFIWDIPKNSQHYAFSKDLIQTWVSFAKNGKPAKFRDAEWESVDSKTLKNLRYLELGHNPKMVQERFSNSVKFWNSLNI